MTEESLGRLHIKCLAQINLCKQRDSSLPLRMTKHQPSLLIISPLRRNSGAFGHFWRQK